MVRDFSVTAVHARVGRDEEQAGCVTLQSQRVHACVCRVGSKQGA